METELGIFSDITQSEYWEYDYLRDAMSIMWDYSDRDFFTRKLTGVTVFIKTGNTYRFNKPTKKFKKFVEVAARHVYSTKKKLDYVANGPPINARYRGEDLTNDDLLKFRINPDIMTLADDLHREMLEKRRGWHQKRVDLTKELKHDDREGYQLAVKHPLKYGHTTQNTLDQVEQHFKKRAKERHIPYIPIPKVSPNKINVDKIMIVCDEEMYKFTRDEIPELLKFLGRWDLELLADYLYLIRGGKITPEDLQR